MARGRRGPSGPRSAAGRDPSRGAPLHLRTGARSARHRTPGAAGRLGYAPERGPGPVRPGQPTPAAAAATASGGNAGRLPVRRGQWRQAVRQARAIALRARHAVLPGGLQRPAGTGALRVDAAARATHLALEGDAARLPGLGAAHRHPVAVQRLDQPGRHRAVGIGRGLQPVEGDAEVGAAGATAKARMRHGRTPGGCRGRRRARRRERARDSM